MADTKCPICKTHYGEAHTEEFPQWVHDPIPTPNAVAGDGYGGIVPVLVADIIQLQKYYTYLGEQFSITAPTWLGVDSSVGITRAHITQLRKYVEHVLTTLGMTLENYFDGDKYGDTYTSTQTDWTDVDRQEGHPNLPYGVPVRAIHIEELRRGLEGRITTYLPTSLNIKTNVRDGLLILEFSGSFSFSKPGFDPLLVVQENPTSPAPTITFIDDHAKHFNIHIEVTAISGDPLYTDQIASIVSTIKFRITRTGSYSYPDIHFGRYVFDYSWYLRGAYPLQKNFGIAGSTYRHIDLESSFWAADEHKTLPDFLDSGGTWVEYKRVDFGGPEAYHSYQYMSDNDASPRYYSGFGIRKVKGADAPDFPESPPISFYARLVNIDDPTDFFEINVLYDSSI